MHGPAQRRAQRGDGHRPRRPFQQRLQPAGRHGQLAHEESSHLIRAGIALLNLRPVPAHLRRAFVVGDRLGGRLELARRAHVERREVGLADVGLDELHGGGVVSIPERFLDALRGLAALLAHRRHHLRLPEGNRLVQRARRGAEQLPGGRLEGLELEDLLALGENLGREQRRVLGKESRQPQNGRQRPARAHKPDEDLHGEGLRRVRGLSGDLGGLAPEPVGQRIEGALDPRAGRLEERHRLELLGEVSGAKKERVAAAGRLLEGELQQPQAALHEERGRELFGALARREAPAAGGARPARAQPALRRVAGPRNAAEPELQRPLGARHLELLLNLDLVPLL